MRRVPPTTPYRSPAPVETLHQHCAVCVATAQGMHHNPGVESLCLLTLLHHGVSPQKLLKGLCFVHRRIVEDQKKFG